LPDAPRRAPGRAVDGRVGGLLIAARAIQGRPGADRRQSVDAAVPPGDVVAHDLVAVHLDADA
jgi:hypothetical protein